MPAQDYTPGPDGEVLRPAFPDITESERPQIMLSYGISFDKACEKHISGFIDAQRVFILASRSLAAKTECVSKLEAKLGPKHVGTWLGVPPHTPYDGIIPILQDVLGKQADCIVVLGGGSLADGAKLLVYAAENGVYTVNDLINLEESFKNNFSQQALKGFGNPAKISLVFMPITLSGAEYSKFAGCTNPTTHMKVQFTHPSMYARLLILDPDLCLTTPDRFWRSTGVRAIDHCVENICSPTARAESDAACERALRLMVKSLLAYARDSCASRVRLESQLACNYALTGLNLMVLPGASHGIGHNLGPLGVGHGETSCVLLPAVMKYNAAANPKQQAIAKEILWSESEIADVLRKHGLAENESDVADALRAIFDELGMPASLRDIGVGREKWDLLAENSLADVLLPLNPIPITTKKQVIEILELCSGY